ncbi:hypothetical protein [Protaetiibacter intestinalis]|uniref:Uncharacterized protein n=1 Tax=Protaetiibacter intestinalis TaxID=2419774 RepID=A0A387B5C3_9MICO|nr:hypothetical protein [Protaetiibacter intestinalis]AYF96911.1 hypothetical protein D7I47_00680 [Protaetiibacter intestinalis]
MAVIGSVRIVQTHDALGRVAPAEFLQPLADTVSLEVSVAEFLAPLDPRPTDRPGVYTYRDPQRGSGWLELVGFSPGALERAADALLMERVEAEVGEMTPFRNEDMHLPRGGFGSRNPWLMLVFGAVVAGVGVWTIVVGLTRVELPFTIVVPVLGVLLIAAATWLFLHGARRVRWWHAARATARRLEGRLPDRLQS